MSEKIGKVGGLKYDKKENFGVGGKMYIVIIYVTALMQYADILESSQLLL